MMTFEAAKAKYVHRFTMEHKPAWADTPAPNGSFYAPQYRSDWEWYCNTVFPPFHPLGSDVEDCYSTGQTFPLGIWLQAAFVPHEGLADKLARTHSEIQERKARA